MYENFVEKSEMKTVRGIYSAEFFVHSFILNYCDNAEQIFHRKWKSSFSAFVIESSDTDGNYGTFCFVNTSLKFGNFVETGEIWSFQNFSESGGGEIWKHFVKVFWRGDTLSKCQCLWKVAKQIYLVCQTIRLILCVDIVCVEILVQ